MEKPIRIVVANDHPIIRSDLRLLLERQPTFRVVGEAANGREAVLLAQFRHPDIVLLDVKLPQVSGMAAAREIASASRSLELSLSALSAIGNMYRKLPKRELGDTFSRMQFNRI